MIPFRRFRPWRRRLIALAVVAVVLGVLATIALVVVYPRVGESTLRNKVVPRLASKLGRAVTLGAVEIRLGHAELHDLVVAGLGNEPLATVAKVSIEFDTLPSLWGEARVRRVVVDGVRVRARRAADGTDDVRDVLDRLRGRGPGGAAASGSSGLGKLRPDLLLVRGIEAAIVDEVTGTRATIGDGDATMAAGQPARLTLRTLDVHGRGDVRGQLAAITIERTAGAPPTLQLEGGAGQLWAGLAFTGIHGTVTPQLDGARYDLDLTGGYGGVEGDLWTAKGHVEPPSGSAVVDLVAKRFTLDRLAPILAGTAVIEPERTSVDADFHLEVARQVSTFRGGFHVSDLNVTHPLVADKPVRALDFAGDVAGTLDRAAHSLTLARGEFVTGEMPFSFTGSVQMPGGLRELRARLGALRGHDAADLDADPEADDLDVEPAAAAPAVVAGTSTAATSAKVDVRLVIPPVACQRALDVIPKAAAPYLAGYQLTGTYQANLHLAIDWANLDGLILDGIDSRLGLGGCTVVRAPADSPLRLRGEFEHYVEVEKGQWLTVWVGHSNPDYVPLSQVSPYLPRSLQTTEDSSFFSHHGFITREFRTALVSNLKAGRFKHGASSISMQLVKNALLYREKTLARKLQELILTWHMEQVLSKERILEIYINIIEYGPGIYGIGEAARHYFGKPASDLTPVEAAFFSTILPNPKERYAQYCAGTLRRTTEAKIGRIVDLMLKRGRLTEEEWTLAKATPLVFARDGIDQDACMGRRSRALRNARPTNPLKK